LYYYSVKDWDCPRVSHCVSPGEVRKKVSLSDCRRLRNEEWKEKYGERPVVERDFSHARLHRGLERARYRISVLAEVLVDTQEDTSSL